MKKEDIEKLVYNLSESIKSLCLIKLSILAESLNFDNRLIKEIAEKDLENILEIFNKWNKIKKY